MKLYSLKIITGAELYNTTEEADGYLVEGNCIYFYIKEDEIKKVISQYPASRTIISHIRELKK